MAMDKTAQLPRSRRRGLNHTQEQILLLVNELRFLTRKAIWRILYAKGSFTHAGETLKKLADEGYLTRVGGTHLRRDTFIPQRFQASKAAAASDGHAVHF